MNFTETIARSCSDSRFPIWLFFLFPVFLSASNEPSLGSSMIWAAAVLLLGALVWSNGMGQSTRVFPIVWIASWSGMTALLLTGLRTRSQLLVWALAMTGIGIAALFGATFWRKRILELNRRQEPWSRYEMRVSGAMLIGWLGFQAISLFALHLQRFHWGDMIVTLLTLLMLGFTAMDHEVDEVQR